MGHILHPGYFPYCGATVVCNTPARTLEQLMYEYWVARYWKITVFMSDGGAGSPPAPEYNFYFGLGSYLNPIGKEEDIPCNYGFDCMAGDCDQFDGLVFVNQFNDISLCSKIQIVLSRFAEANDDSLYINEIPPEWEVNGTKTLSFGDGHTLELPYAISSQQPGADPDSYYEFIDDFNIQISHYWTYGGTYNESTGA